MFKCLGFLLGVALLLPAAGAQTVLFPVLDATAGGPAAARNWDNFFVVQPSRHGTVFVLPLFAGDSGYQALPVMTLDANYSNDNSSLLSIFSSLDEQNHLVFPNPIGTAGPAWLTLVGTLQSGMLTPFTPAFEVTPPNMRDIAMYFQMVELLQVSSNPTIYDYHLSNGMTIVATEAGGSELAAPATSATAKRGASMVAADFNGDGVDDLAVGAPGESGGGRVGAGRVLVYVGVQGTPGTPGGLSAVPFIIEEPNLASIAIGENPGPEINAHFGATLAAGDVDGNGFQDLIVGVPEADGVTGETDQGEVFVFRGLSTQIPATAPPFPQILVPAPTTVVQVRPLIERAFARFGLELAVGNLNGDLADDVVASAPFLDVSLIAEQEIGAVYAFFGPLGAQNFQTEDQLVNDSVIGSYERFGASLALGDLDANGIKEVIVGVPGQAAGATTNNGKIVALQFNGSAFVPVLSLANPDGLASSGYGLSVSAGDINGDGKADILTSSDATVGGVPYAGTCFIHRLGNGFTSTLESFSPPSPQSYERFAREILVADLNADGIDDVVCGAPGCPTGGHPFAGRAYVYFGSPNPTLNDTFRTLWITPPSPGPRDYALFGTSLAAGDFAGAGVNDLAIGEPLAAPSGSTFATGRVNIYTDLLHRKDNLLLPQFLGGTPPQP